MAPPKRARPPAKKKGTYNGKEEDSKKGYKKPPSAKNQLRSIERMLKRELPPKMKEKSLQKLQQLQKQLQTNKSTELERRYAIRYHKIRFFERVKLERQIKQLQREGPASDGTEHQQKLQRLRADLQYVREFPKGHKYVSILKTAGNPAAQAQLDQQREQLRQLARQQAADRAALAEGDEGRSLGMLAPPRQQAAPDASQAPTAAADDEDDFLVPEDQEAPQATSQPSASAVEPFPQLHASTSAPPPAATAAWPKQQARPAQKPQKQSIAARPAPHKHKSKAGTAQPGESRPARSGGQPRAEACVHEASTGVPRKSMQGAASKHRTQKGSGVGQAGGAKAAVAKADGPRGAKVQPPRSALQAPKQAAGKQGAAAAKVPEKRPARTRAEGGRKRRKK